MCDIIIISKTKVVFTFLYIIYDLSAKPTNKSFGKACKSYMKKKKAATLMIPLNRVYVHGRLKITRVKKKKNKHVVNYNII